MSIVNKVQSTRHNNLSPCSIRDWIECGLNVFSLFYKDFLAMEFLQVPAYPIIGRIQITIANSCNSVFTKFLVKWRFYEPRTNTGWSAWVTEAAIFRPAFPVTCRLLGEMLQHNFYIGTRLTTATLSVATIKGGMSSQLD